MDLHPEHALLKQLHIRPRSCRCLAKLFGALTATPLWIVACADAGMRPVPRLSLGASDTLTRGEFAYITALRELADGERVLVADLQENRLALIDWSTATERNVLRRGEGPGEYSLIGDVYVLADDSTMVTDLAIRRWFLLDSALAQSTLSGAQHPLIIALGGMLRGADRAGRVLAVRSAVAPPSHGPLLALDSLVLVSGVRGTDRVDTLDMLRGPGTRQQLRISSGSSVHTVLFDNPLRPGDDALLLPDGWIAVARAEPYRVDWISPDGSRVRGPPLPMEQVHVGEPERRAALRRAFPTRASSIPTEAVTNWPELLPPFGERPLVAAPDGRVLVRRYPVADSSDTAYDVIDRGGNLAATLRLPANEVIVGSGRARLYTIVTDDDGIQRVRRYDWPGP